MEDQPTCGRGLAEHSLLPAKLGELFAAMAENLELHLTALDVKDQNAKAEHDAYVKLAKEHRELAARLLSTANLMASYRDLPMGSHDAVAMSAPRVAEAFETFVRVKRELANLLQKTTFQDEKMLAQMRAASRT